MEIQEIEKALEKLAKGGKVKTKAVTYEYEPVTKARTKTKEVVTTKEFLPDKTALSKILELKGLKGLKKDGSEDEFEI